MTQKKKRRGRPKGTGIDDRARLRAIAKLIAANPSLRPTTAIKALGFDNPSVIRRLRDKYKAEMESSRRRSKRRGKARRRDTAEAISATRSAMLTGPRDAIKRAPRAASARRLCGNNPVEPLDATGEPVPGSAAVDDHRGRQTAPFDDAVLTMIALGAATTNAVIAYQVLVANSLGQQQVTRTWLQAQIVSAEFVREFMRSPVKRVSSRK